MGRRVTTAGSKPGWKRCTRCRQEKPATRDYFSSGQGYLGCAAWCRVCKNASIERPGLFRLAGALKQWRTHEPQSLQHLG